MKSIVERLADAVAEDPDSPVRTGRVAARGLSVRFADGESASLITGKGTPSQRGLSTLMKRMEPAPFGFGPETKVDRAVRDALQLSARGGAFEIVGVPLDEVLDQARATLLPSERARLRAELLSLNVYRKGGHFVSHKDTPRGDRMIASLVLCLPFGFGGGELSLRHEGRTTVVDFAREITDEPGALSWAAFFSDVDHEIAEVTSGCRVTLSYALRVGNAKGARSSDRPAPSTDLQALFGEAARDEELRRQGAILRIPCAHQYEARRDGPSARRIDEDGTRDLKGRDGEVARAARAAGLEVELVHCLAILEEGGDELTSIRLLEQPTKDRLARLRARLSTQSTEPLENDLADDDALTRDVHTVGVWDRGLLLGRALFSSTGYYGNECYDSVFYVSSVLDVLIPSARSGQGLRVVHKKFGAGVVQAKVGEGAEAALRVRFESGEERTILERFFERS